MAQRLGHGFGLGVHVQLRVDALHVEGDGIDAAAERGGGGLVAVTLGQQAEEPQLVWREVVIGERGRAEFAEERDDAAGDFRLTSAPRRSRPPADTRTSAAAAFSSAGTPRRPRTAPRRFGHRLRRR